MKNKNLEKLIMNLKKEGFSDAYIISFAWASRCNNTSITEISRCVKSLQKLSAA